MAKKARNKEIFKKYQAGMTLKEIGQEYGISAPAAHGIVKRQEKSQQNKRTTSFNLKFYDPNEPRCLKCGCTAYQKGGVRRDGTKMYICKKCKSQYVAPDKRVRAIHGTKCPFCGGKAIKNGIDKLGKQKYQCKECQKFFIQNYIKFPKIPEKMVKQAKIYLKVQGLRIVDIAKMVGISPAKVSRIKAGLKKAG